MATFVTVRRTTVALGEIGMTCPGHPPCCAGVCCDGVDGVDESAPYGRARMHPLRWLLVTGLGLLLVGAALLVRRRIGDRMA